MEGLNVRPDGVYVDVTFGGGGHSRAMMRLLGPEGKLFAFDKDRDAMANGIDDDRFVLINEDFRYLKRFLRVYGVRYIDGVLADLGVSSHQLDVAERGFSTRFDGPLDLRMDSSSGATASELVNRYGEEELQRIFSLYGELPNAKSLAHAIVLARNGGGINTTAQLRDAVSRHLPHGKENKWLAMIFQALRIEVNGELEALKQMLEQATEMLREGGRLCVISYHSLEDRLVKNYMKAGNFKGELEKDFYGNPQVPLKQVWRKARTASEEEISVNNRARSAKLRVGEKV